MTPTDFDSFSEVVLGFAELKGKQLSAAAIELYWRAMQHWQIEDFRTAAQHLLRKCEFMPTPAEFERLRAVANMTAGEAWNTVLDHCTGGYRGGVGVDAGGPIDQAVAALGGYQAVAMHNTSFLHVIERRFAEHYKNLIDVAEARASVPKIASNLRPGSQSDLQQEALSGLRASPPPKRDYAASSGQTAGRAM